MKKLLIPLFFLGSCSMAMAQVGSPLSSTGLWQRFSATFRRAAPIAPVVMPKTTQVVNTIINTAQHLSKCTDPAEIAYCNAGNTGVEGGCYPLRDRCWGSSKHMDCRPINCSKSDIRPTEQKLDITITRGDVACKDAPNDDNHCKELIMSPSGSPTPEEKLKMEEEYRRCMMVRWYMPVMGTISASLNLNVKGGTGTYSLRPSYLSLPLPRGAKSATGYVNVYKGDTLAAGPIPVTLNCPVQQVNNCSLINTRMQVLIKELYAKYLAAGENDNDAMAHAQSDAAQYGKDACTGYCAWISPSASGVGGSCQMLMRQS